MSANSGKYMTNDISIAAFLMMKGLSLANAASSGGKYIFEFDDPSGLALGYVLSFPSTPFGQYDSYLRMLRGILKNSP